MDTDIIIKICIWAIPVLFAISVHEWAHGFIAFKLGDNMAETLGRLSINPIRHIDLVGTIIVPIAMFFLGGFIFGWAKPVPINTRNFSRPERDMAIVAIAGPISNLLMAIFWAIIVVISKSSGLNFLNLSQFIVLVGLAGIQINLILMIVNMLPIPPLDGSRILMPLLPYKFKIVYSKIEGYGFFILIALLALGILGSVLLPIYSFFLNIFLRFVM